MSKISLCMIVKNEEPLLPRALANWRALADELIIVDTGSTDGTVAVAEYFGAKLLRYEWIYPGHKGEARNVGIDAATGEWIIVLDADEVIREVAALREFLLTQAGDLDCIDVQFHNYNEAGQVVLAWSQARIFRRGLYRYRHREHEMPLPVDDQPKRTGTINTVFEHRQPAERVASKMQPMIDRLLADVQEYPDDVQQLYFLHRQYALGGQWERAIQVGRQYLQLAQAKGLDRCECYGNLAHVHLQRNEPDAAIQYLHKAAAEQPQRRIWWVLLAELYFNHQQFNIALALLRCAAELWPQAEQNYQPLTSTTHLYDLIQRCQLALATGEHSHG